MEREIVRRMSEQELGENLNGKRVFVYRFSDDEEGQFSASLIEPSAGDKLSSFVYQEINTVMSHIKTTRREIHEYSKKKRHGQYISSAQVTMVRRRKEEDINSMIRQLRILEGKEIHPIVLEKEDDEITGSNLRLTGREAHWWSYLKQNPELLELPEKDCQFLTRAYFARYDIKANLEGAKERYYELLKELGEKEHLTDFVVGITKYLTS